jgi:hypothetical protein
VAIPRGNASIICGASYHVWDLPSVIICDDVAKDPSDRLSPLTSAKSCISESRYLARYFPANILSNISSLLSDSLPLTFIVHCLVMTGSSTISNQLEAGSIMVRAMSRSVNHPYL